MSEIFVAGDIHGNYQGLMESLNAAGWQEGDTIICVGDVTDRGKDNARTVSFLQEHKCDVRLVQGNHELQHKKLLQYYHVLIKVPQIRLFAAGIFRTYKAGYTYPKTKEELKEYECSADRRIEIIQGKPKTFHAFVRAFIAYTLAWEDDSLWKIILYLLEEIYDRKASPEIWALNNFKEFEVWYNANKKELETNARKKGPKSKTAAKKAA